MSQVKGISKDQFDAVLFDLDGVITQTSHVHARCWKTMFDEFLQQFAKTHNIPFQPFDIDKDYGKYVDGKPRYEGARSFLESRGISLPQGDEKDPAGKETVCGLGNRKDELVKAAIEAGEVKVYESSITLVRKLREEGFKLGVVSSSKNCEAILKVVGILDLFSIRVDGLVAAALKLPGKPAPDTFKKGAELLGVEPSHTVVVEDALAGVEAGKRGNFGLVIGVDRLGQAEALKENGADIVVQDLGELLG